MFDLPDAKRVRRSELVRDASCSPPPSVPDPALEAQFRARLEELYGAPTFAPQDEVGDEGEPGAEPVLEEEVFEFRLFDGGAGDGAQKIVLRDEEDGAEGGFVTLKDPREFVVGKAVGERKIRIERAAVSGEEILQAAKKRAWGLEVPWRVKVIKVAGKQKSGVHDGDTVGTRNEDYTEEEGGTRKTRPSQKRRILLRDRKRVKDQMAEKRRVEKESKEEAEREKRTRRNREKKVKRKLKEKAKKAGGANGNDAVGIGDNADPGVTSSLVDD